MTKKIKYPLLFIITLLLGFIWMRLISFEYVVYNLLTFTSMLHEFSIPIIRWMIKLNPERDFLIQILTFETVILAIAIPLSVDMISRMSEKFQSDILTERFRNEWVVKWLTVTLILGIVIKILVIFFHTEYPDTKIWKFVCWFSLVIFIFVVFMLVKYVQLLYRYLSHSATSFLLESLLDEARRTIRR